MISKKYLIPAAAAVVLGAGVYGVASVTAATSTGTRTPLAQAIANAFHLDQSKVQSVIDQNHTANQAVREQNYEQRLSQAVTDGKITPAQKDLILAEHNKLAGELKSAMSNTSVTPAERRTSMQKIRTEAQDWATQNNIDAKWLLVPGGFGRGHMGPGHMGPRI